MKDRCFHCYETGHKFSNCPRRRRDDGDTLEKEDEEDTDSSDEDQEVSEDNVSQRIPQEEEQEEEEEQPTTHSTQEQPATDSTTNTPNTQHTPNQPQHSTPKTHKSRKHNCNTSNPAFASPDTPTPVIEKHPDLRVKRKYPKTPIKTPHTWKKAKPNTAAYILSQKEEITPEALRLLIKEPFCDSILDLSPNLALLEEHEQSFFYPLQPFDYDIIFSPTPIQQYYERRTYDDERPPIFHTL